MKRRHAIEEDLASAIEELTGQGHHGSGLVVPRFARILVATNGSRASMDAVDWACLLAKGLASAVHLVSVGVAEAHERAQRGDASLAFESGIADPQEVLRVAVQRCSAQGVRPVEHEATGSLVHEVVKVCQESAIDLLIVGAGVEGTVEFTGMGSVAHQLKASAPCSVLVARGPPVDGPVLCGVDGSGSSQVAARAAVGVAQAIGSSVVVLHVRPSGGPVQLPKPTKPTQWDHKPVVTFESATGTAAAALIGRSRDLRASLVVLGARGVSGVPGWSLGSVSDRASAQADASVLVVKTEG